MKYPDYFMPSNLSEVLEILASNKNAKVIAGGTDLLPSMRSGVVQPEVLIDLKGLNLNKITLQPDHICIGACTTHSQIQTSPIVLEKIPILAGACQQIGSPPIQNRGTVGGNLVNASPAADTATPLLVLDASLLLEKQNSDHKIPLSEFFIGPGKTCIKPTEVLKEIHIPIPRKCSYFKFLKMGKRKAMAIAIISLAACLSVDEDGLIQSIRIAFGSIAPIPIRAKTVEEKMEGQLLRADIIEKAIQSIHKDISPISDIRASANFREDMAEVLLRRVLLDILADHIGEK